MQGYAGLGLGLGLGFSKAFLKMLTKIERNQRNLIFPLKTIYTVHGFGECSLYAYVLFFRWLALSNENRIPLRCETKRESFPFVSDSDYRHCGRHLEIFQSHDNDRVVNLIQVSSDKYDSV